MSQFTLSVHPQPLYTLTVDFQMNWMHESLVMNNYFVLVYSVVDAAYIAISSPHVRYNNSSGKNVVNNNSLQGWCISFGHPLKPTAPGSTFHNANDPFTSPVMILSSKVIGFVDLNTTGSAIGIEATQLNMLIHEPVAHKSNYCNL